MERDRNGSIQQHLRLLFSGGSITGLTDGQLLDQFTTRRGEASEPAFAALVERHGPMVLLACRSILRDEHDAQDAFQATFLILARKAGSLWIRDSVGPWLHRVACRVAVRSKLDSDRRRGVERRAAEMKAQCSVAAERDERSDALHEAIDRLPERYRIPIVLCDLESRTYDEAAQQLGCPVGTVKSRLARGREQLRRRLAGRGAALGTDQPGAGLAAPAGLMEETIRAALRLAAGSSGGLVPTSILTLVDEGVKVMMLTKLKLASAALASIAVVTAGVTVLAQQGPNHAQEVVQEKSQAPKKSLDGAGSVATSPPGGAADRGAAATPEDQERRIRDLEQKLSRLLNDRVRVGGARNPGERMLEPGELEEEDGKKAHIWDVLTIGGYVGQFDLAEVTPKEMVLRLFRGYYGIMPSAQELSKLLEIVGSRPDQLMAPEEIVRRLINSPYFRSTLLVEAILRNPRTRNEPGVQ
ncbi:RNA polymerase sigma factor [Paludisphaera borealis]|uniref:ECF RNA polymerase sigma factor SigE n=1 Tax=Paludisphaera borealis TaxID=1387353 RepID=A0A1U7CMR8_9BACT|nr:RNA polymerase sigma factor [Paludisphaera borealis]APW60235.1 ECF RNA polymerase sigma factor SigE [Paludisphaera borealis]